MKVKELATVAIAGYFFQVQIFLNSTNGLTTQENLFWAVA